MFSGCPNATTSTLWPKLGAPEEDDPLVPLWAALGLTAVALAAFVLIRYW